MSFLSLRAPSFVRRTPPARPAVPVAPAPSAPRREVTTLTVVDVVGLAVLDQIAADANEYSETIARKRAEFAALHPFDLPRTRIVSGGAM